MTYGFITLFGKSGPDDPCIKLIGWKPNYLAWVNSHFYYVLKGKKLQKRYAYTLECNPDMTPVIIDPAPEGFHVLVDGR